MESKIDQRESAARLLALDPRDARSAYRARVEEMVRDQESRAGGLMAAYRLVGRWVGKSATTVRRIIAGHSVDLDPETLHACDKAWAAHHTRLEHRALQIVAAAERRRTATDAISSGRGGLGARLPDLGAEPAARAPGPHDGSDPSQGGVQ